MVNSSFFYPEFKFRCLSGKVNLTQDTVLASLTYSSENPRLSDKVILVSNPVRLDNLTVSQLGQLKINEIVFKGPFKSDTANGLVLYTNDYRVLYCTLDTLNLFMLHEVIIEYTQTDSILAEL